nr:piggyBac transposable element-derived protein 3-like [Hydra vulgaris]
MYDSNVADPEELNNYFVIIGPKLAAKVPPNFTSFDSYLKTYDKLIDETSLKHSELRVAFSSFKSKKREGFDKISVDIVKSVFDIIEPSLFHMNPKNFYGSTKRLRIPFRKTVFPVNQPKLSEVSDLSGESDEDFITSESESEYGTSEWDSETSDGNEQQQAPQLSSSKTHQHLLQQPQPTYQPQEKKRNLIWKIKKDDDVQQINLPFQNSEDKEDDNNGISDEPISYVRRFLTDELLQKIVDESNKYASQINIENMLRLEKDELEQFIGILYLMSIVKLPSTRMYWSNELYFEKVAAVMTLNRFEKIKLFLHCNDDRQRPENCTDKLYKIRPIINMLKESFISLKHDKILCIDEQVVPFKGRSSLKQYNPHKPKKWGFKFYILASVDGLVNNFEIHSGSIDVCVGQPDLKASGNIVMHLLVNVPRHKWHKLFFDIWYTGFDLVKTLYHQGIACTGTVRTNRLPNIKMSTDGELKKEGRGSTAIRVTTVDNVELRAIKWFDNRGVALLTSYEAVNPINIVNRWDRKTKRIVQVKRPSVVTTYNTYMGGVDLLDGMLSLYRIHIRSKKWYHKLIWHFFDLIVVQAWILYCRDMKKSQALKKDIFQLRIFKLKVAKCLVQSDKALSSRRGRPSTSVDHLHRLKRKRGPAANLPEPSTRKDNIGHFPFFVDKKGRCKYPGCTGITKVFCEKCKVHLCFTSNSNCFRKFHE